MFYFDAKAKRLNNRRKAQKEQLVQDEMDPEKYKILTNGKGLYKIQFPSGNITTIAIESIEHAKQCIERYVKISKEQWEETHQVWTEVPKE